MEKIEFSQWLFEGRLRQGKKVLPDGLNWLCYFAGSSKSHRENSISFIFLESPHQVDMKNVVKSSKHFFGYFNALETHSGPFFYSSLTQSGRSSLRSSTEEDYSDSSKNTSFATPRYTVLMLGSTDSGKTTLTSQFMSSNNMRGYINETIGKCHTCIKDKGSLI